METRIKAYHYESHSVYWPQVKNDGILALHTPWSGIVVSKNWWGDMTCYTRDIEIAKQVIDNYRVQSAVSETIIYPEE